jgi:hypothetical protein
MSDTENDMASPLTVRDAELTVLRSILYALAKLEDPRAQRRVLNYVRERTDQTTGLLFHRGIGREIANETPESA